MLVPIELACSEYTKPALSIAKVTAMQETCQHVDVHLRNPQLGGREALQETLRQTLQAGNVPVRKLSVISFTQPQQSYSASPRSDVKLWPSVPKLGTPAWHAEPQGILSSS